MRELAEAGARATGCRLDGFRGHGPPCAGPGGAPLSGPAAAAARRTLDRAAGAERHRGSCPGARAFRGLARRGAGAERHRRRRGGREPGAVAGAVAAARIDPLAQAEEGLNVKHDISLPVSAIPEFVASTDALLRRRFPGVQLVNFGHLGDGNLHYNVQAPRAATASASWTTTSGASTPWSSTRWCRMAARSRPNTASVP